MGIYTYPGVYVEELPATLPGRRHEHGGVHRPDDHLPMREPTKITNWSQFVDTFGGYFPQQPLLFMAYAVRGYFQNGGREAYVVRVGTALQAYRDLPARGTGNSLRVQRAKEFGTGGNLIKIELATAQIVPTAQNAKIHKARAEITSAIDDVVTLKNPAETSLFRIGDIVGIEIDERSGGDLRDPPRRTRPRRSPHCRVHGHHRISEVRLLHPRPARRRQTLPRRQRRGHRGGQRSSASPTARRRTTKTSPWSS